MRFFFLLPLLPWATTAFTQSSNFRLKTALKVAAEPPAPPKAAAKDDKPEKISKEAQELLDVLEGKTNYKLVIAQTAPAVRYVQCLWCVSL